MTIPQRKSFDEAGVQFAWDGTSLEAAQTCLRKYYYSIVLGIRPKNKSVHLIFGGIYASCLESFYKWRAEGDDYETALERTVEKALKDSWDREAGHPIPFDDDKKTRPNLIRTIIWYLEQWGNEHEDNLTTYHLASGKPAVELSFAVDLDDDILYCGHLDRVCEMAGHKYILDQKTTGGTIGTWWAEQFSPNNQMSGYAYAGAIILQTPIKGVIIDGAQIAQNFSRFERHPTTRTKAQIIEWRESALYTIDLARHATAVGKFPMNLSACNNYGSFSSQSVEGDGYKGGCPFRPLCSRDPAIRENFIKSDYVQHVWDPLQER